MIRLWSYCKPLLFPPRCAGCHGILGPWPEGAHDSIFCPECALQFEKEMRCTCALCGLPFFECRCQPASMKKAKVLGLVKLAPYVPDAEHRVMHRIILEMKKEPRPHTAQYLARELKEQVAATIGKNGFDTETCCIAYLPRAKRTRRRTGTDQALELAQALSLEMGIPLEPLLERSGRTNEQKRLDAKARAANLKNAFSVVGDPSGKCILLVDDLVTTGAGMSAASALLCKAGAVAVIAVAAAYTPRRRGGRH